MSPFTFVPAYGLPVYASQCTLPATTQDSVRGCWLDFPAAAISDGWLTYAYKAQPSQIPPRGITPVGSSGKTHCSGPGTCDPGSQKRLAMHQLPLLFPGKRPPPRPPPEPLFPGPLDAPIELPQAAVVRGPSVVLVMATEFRVKTVVAQQGYQHGY